MNIGCPWISMDIRGYSWVSMGIRGFPWNNHRCPRISQDFRADPSVTKWDASEVERISTRPISMICSCASLPSSRFSSFHFLLLCMGFCFRKLSGRSRGPPRIVLGATGATKDHFEAILCEGDFTIIIKIMRNQLVQCFQ